MQDIRDYKMKFMIVIMKIVKQHLYHVQQIKLIL
jgi:hypothetical protein